MRTLKEDFPNTFEREKKSVLKFAGKSNTETRKQEKYEVRKSYTGRGRFLYAGRI